MGLENVKKQGFEGQLKQKKSHLQYSCIANVKFFLFSKLSKPLNFHKMGGHLSILFIFIFFCGGKTMTEILTLVVLIIFIGAFIVKFGELFLALAKALSYFAVPLTIAGVIFFGPKLIHWLLN